MNHIGKVLFLCIFSFASGSFTICCAFCEFNYQLVLDKLVSHCFILRENICTTHFKLFWCSQTLFTLGKSPNYSSPMDNVHIDRIKSCGLCGDHLLAAVRGQHLCMFSCSLTALEDNIGQHLCVFNISRSILLYARQSLEL